MYKKASRTCKVVDFLNKHFTFLPLSLLPSQSSLLKVPHLLTEDLTSDDNIFFVCLNLNVLQRIQLPENLPTCANRTTRNNRDKALKNENTLNKGRFCCLCGRGSLKSLLANVVGTLHRHGYS